MGRARAFAVWIVIGLAAPATASAATITVTNNNDSGPGSLRQAIATAAPGDTIIVPANTYLLTSGELSITQSLTIEGAGENDTFIDGNGQFRPFETTGSNSTIVISGVTIRDGLPAPVSGTAEGGGVLNSGANLTLRDDLIDGDNADANGAGASGAGGTAEGGGVFNDAGSTLNVIDTVFSSDLADADGDGGQRGNLADGGGLYSLGTLTVVGATFTNDNAVAVGGQGSNNTNQTGGIADGGGLQALEGAITISSSTFDGDTADASGGPGGGGGIAQGGGAWVATNTSAVALANLTITGSVVRATGTSGGQGLGGGLNYGSNGPVVTLTNSTIAANSATGSALNQGGDAYLGGSNTHVENTIIDAGVADQGSQNCAGSPVSLGHNIDSLNQCGFNAAGDQTNTDPLLGPLHDNGGPAPTMALLAGSPAIDQGASGGCPPTDERGVLRPAGAACDIGAFEVATPAASTGHETAMMLHGIAFNPDINPGSAEFQYGTTASYGSATASEPVPATTRQDAISALLPSLAPGVYHFRLVVMNGVSTTDGADASFAIDPVLSDLKLAPDKLKAGKRTTVSYTDDAAGVTTFVIERKVRNHWERIGHSFTHRDAAGRNSVRPKRTFTPGAYRLIATPESNGATGQAVLVSFEVLAKPKPKKHHR